MSFKKKFLVTGGAGFIGSHLVRVLLSQRHSDVIVIDDFSNGYLDNFLGIHESDFKLVKQSILDVNLVELMEGVDAVFHFAAISSLPECQANPIQAIRVNVEGTARVLEAARRSRVRRVIFASTSAVYENCSPPFSETQQVKPDLIYSWSKHCCESLCNSYHLNYGLDVVISRFFNVYGPAQNHRRTSPPFTSYLIRTLLNGETPTIYNLSQIKRDYIFVTDLLDLVIALSEFPDYLGGEIFNLGSGQGYSALEILEIASELTKHDGSYVSAIHEKFWEKYPELYEGLSLDSSRLEREIFKLSLCDPYKIQSFTGIKPKYSMYEGLKAMVGSTNDSDFRIQG